MASIPNDKGAPMTPVDVGAIRARVAKQISALRECAYLVGSNEHREHVSNLRLTRDADAVRSAETALKNDIAALLAEVERQALRIKELENGA